MRDIARAYEGGEVKAEGFTAFEYALTEQALMSTGAYQEAEKHFDAIIAGMEATMYPTSVHLDNTDKHTAFATSTVPADSITAFCRRNGITPANHFLASLMHVLWRITREDGVLVTTIHNGRDDARMQESYGMLVKTLPVAMTGDRACRFTESALSLQRQVAESADRSLYPFTHIVSRHGVRPNILYAYQGLQDYVAKGHSELLAGSKTMPLELDMAKVPLSVEIRPAAEGFELLAEYDTALYSRFDMDTLLGMIGTFAQNAAAAADNALASSIPLLSEAERERISVLGQGERHEYDASKTWVDLFVEAAKEHGDSVAVADRDNRLT